MSRLYPLALTLFTLLTGLSLQAQGQKGYSIKGQITGLKDTVVLLGYHYGDKQYLKDTAYVDAIGNFTFEGKERLDGGIYLVVLPSKSYFEIIVPEQQHFSFQTRLDDQVNSFVTKDSKENQLFFDYLKFISPRGKQLEDLRKELTEAGEDTAAASAVRKKMQVLEQEVSDYKDQIAQQHPTTFVATLFNAMKDPVVPDPPILENGRPDSTFRYRYYRAHYFDHINFKDDRILRTPIYHNKLSYFIEKLVPQIPDSINKAADELIARTKGNNELFKYTVWHLTRHHENSKVMGMDAVTWHMYKNYYCTGQAFWVDSATVKKICEERVPRMEHNLLGKTAKEIVGVDTSGNPLALSKLKGPYTVVYFWDSSCGHCKKVTPLVLDEYHKWKDKGVQFLGVNVESETKEWKKYVKENKLDWVNLIDTENKSFFRFYYDIYSTPVIYILDKDKKIIVKRIGAEQISEVLEHEFKKTEMQ